MLSIPIRRRSDQATTSQRKKKGPIEKVIRGAFAMGAIYLIQEGLFPNPDMTTEGNRFRSLFGGHTTDYEN